MSLPSALPVRAPPPACMAVAADPRAREAPFLHSLPRAPGLISGDCLALSRHGGKSSHRASVSRWREYVYNNTVSVSTLCIIFLSISLFSLPVHLPCTQLTHYSVRARRSSHGQQHGLQHHGPHGARSAPHLARNFRVGGGLGGPCRWRPGPPRGSTCSTRAGSKTRAARRA